MLFVVCYPITHVRSTSPPKTNHLICQLKPTWFQMDRRAIVVLKYNLPKKDLCDAAMRELSVSKNAFDFEWMDEIELTGRDDLYEPLRL
jgi:hypothetical protein